MILCDVGNSSANFLKDTKLSTLSLEKFKEFQSDERVFFINVNESLKEHLRHKLNFFDLEPFFKFDTIYKGLGVDRIAACYTIDSGVVVDAGSAITIDIMANNIHLGGFILPGIASYRKAYKEISPRLDLELNTQVIIDAYPQKTIDAISYGVFKGIVLLIQNTINSQKTQLFFTGGDGHVLTPFFDRAIYDKLLVFRGMKKVIEENHLV